MTNFELLYQIATEITKKLDELFYLTSRDVLEEDPNEKSTILEELKILVLKENSLVASMSMENVELCLKELRKILNDNFEITNDDDIKSLDGIELYLKKLIDAMDADEEEYDPNVLLRTFDRLKSRTDIIVGEGVRLKLKQNNTQIMSYDVSVWDATKSILNIETLKRMKKKIFRLIPTTVEDIKFIKELKFNLECFMLTALYSNFASEIQALHVNNDIDKISLPGINKLIELDILDPDLFYLDSLAEGEFLADELSEIVIDSLENNPDSVFYFLRIVTAFEVLISYMDVKTLKEVRDYCQVVTNDQNYPCMSGINNLVKAKIKRQEK